MSDRRSLFPLDDLTALIDAAPEPFLIPDVTPKGWSPSMVFHIVRDLVEAGVLTHGDHGYRRVPS